MSPAVQPVPPHSFPSVVVQDMMMNPFGMFDNMMANMRNRMGEMHRNVVSSLMS